MAEKTCAHCAALARIAALLERARKGHPEARNFERAQQEHAKAYHPETVSA